jgi:uncharacterized OsmC-like protein
VHGEGLRDYIRHKGEALRAAAIRRPRGEDWHETIEATVVADDRTGVRKLRIRDWQFIGDSGADFGGANLGPSSPELLCGVIGTCLAHTYLIGAATLGILVDGVAVRVTAENNDARFLGIETSDPAVPFNLTAYVTIEAGEATTADVATLHRYAAERCPLSNLIRTANPVTIVTGSP